MYNYILHIRTAFIIKKKKWLNAFGQRKNSHYSPFIILCEPRSGSTLLHTFLNYHPHILSYGEFLRENLEARKPMHKSVTDFLMPNTKRLKAVGLKMFYEYAEDSRYSKHVDEIVANHNFKVIHLVRRDKLKQYVFLKIAQKTNVWSSSQKKNIEKIIIDPDDYKHYLTRSLHKKQSLLNLFRHHNILEVFYEDLIDVSQHTLESIQVFLDVKPRRLFSLLSKQNSDMIEDIVENYAEARGVEGNNNVIL